jgi:cell division transport system permease protein
MLGLLGFVLIYARSLTDHLRENIGFTIYLKKNAREASILKFQKSLDASDFVRTTTYISADEAASQIKKELGEDFIGFVGYNPLYPSIEARLKSEYTQLDSIQNIEKLILADELVSEIDYQRDLIGEINSNMHRISIILLGFAVLLLFVSIGLINNTIRLSVYSKRFIIRSMMLIGATQGFIRKPFIFKGMLHGILSAFIASAMLELLIYFASKEIPELDALHNSTYLTILFGVVLFLGIIITGLANYMAVRKYLKMKIDNLYL